MRVMIPDAFVSSSCVRCGGDISFKGHVPLPTPKDWHSHDIFVIVLDDNYTSVADRVLLITQAILLSLMFLNDFVENRTNKNCFR